MGTSNTTQPDINARYRTLLILWGTICVSVGMFLVVISFNHINANENRALTLALNSAGVIPVGLSFLLRRRGLAKATAAQRLDLVQSTYVLRFALCESSALMGLMEYFLTGSGYHYFAFAIAGLGLLFHFPQKNNLVNASSYKPI